MIRTMYTHDYLYSWILIAILSVPLTASVACGSAMMHSKMHRIPDPEPSWVYNHDSGNRQYAIISNLNAYVCLVLL